MAKRRKKRKLSKPPPEDYEFQIKDWEVTYQFRGQTKDDYYHPEKYNELSLLTIYGKPTHPVYKTVSKVQILLWANPELEDHWRDDSSVESSSTVGHMTVLTDKITLDISCSIPVRLYNNIQISLGSGKIKHAQVYGEKLRWGRGAVFRISLSTKVD